MPLNVTVTLTPNTWMQLTDANVTAARVQNYGASPVYVMATVGAVAPVNFNGAILLDTGSAFAADLTLAQLWPGIVGGNRIYAFCDKAVPVSISHA